jgi:hypothetical protein
MARRIPGAQLVIYDDAGHGGIFQYHAAFVKTALAFLGTQETPNNLILEKACEGIRR